MTLFRRLLTEKMADQGLRVTILSVSGSQFLLQSQRERQRETKVKRQNREREAMGK